MRSKSLFEEAKEKLGYNASGSLRPTSEAGILPNFEDLSSISEWLALEKAKRLSADFVYFRRFSDKPSQPLVYVYNYSDKMPEDPALGNIQRDIWSSAEVPCAIIFSKDSVRVINTTREPEQIGGELLPVDLIGLAHEVNHEIQKRLSSYRLDSGEFWHEEADNFAYDRSAHKTLLKKLRAVRERFLNANVLEEGALVNRLLIQCVLIRFLEEKKDKDEKGVWRQVFPPNFFQKIAQANNFREALEKGTFIKVFDYLNKKDSLNGKIFEWSNEEKKQLLDIPAGNLVNLLYETKTNERFQGAFWDLYSFRFLPVEVISSIYEALFTTTESVKEDGMVYTPPHLAAFLVDESMPLSDWQGKSDFKVLDPACGSGVFLVLAFKRLVHWWRLSHQGKSPSVKKLTEILSNSISGVDKNENAILLTRFSLCIAVCEMLAPPEIWSSLHFPTLEKKLIHSDFFLCFENIQKSTAFDLVIGNPPFIKADNSLPEWSLFSGTPIPRDHMALYFLSAGMKVLKKNGLLCLMLKSSSFLYSASKICNNFRTKFLLNYQVHQVIDFTHMARFHILWENQEPDTFALFASNEQSDTSKSILHLIVRRTPSNNLMRYFEIDTYDFNWVPYIAALQDDYIWKCNYLGGGRLYGMIKYLKSVYSNVDKFSKRKSWTRGEGYQTPEDKQSGKPCTHLHEKPSLPYEWLTTRGIEKNGDYPTEDSTLFSVPRTAALFTPPLLVLRKIISDDLKFSVGFSDEYLIFKKQIFGIAVPAEDRDALYNFYQSLRNLGELYHAFIFATSARCLVFKNTSFNPEDIYQLPFNPDGIIKLGENENIIIKDVVRHYQYFLRRKKSDLTNPISPSKIAIRLSQFGSVFCEALNVIYEKNDLKFRLIDAGSIQDNNFLFIAFRYDDQPDFAFSEKGEFAPEAPEEKLLELLTLDKGYAKFSRILKIYKKDYVCFIKPNQLRYWLDSIAFRDADEVITDLVKQGH